MTASSHIHLAPSILAADFLRLGDQVRAVEAAGVRRLQIDVMDGRFVPNISVGVPVVSAIRSAVSLLLEVHLMIVEPERYVPTFAQAGADLIIVHVEASPHLYRTLQQIHDLGKQAGVALNPATPAGAVSEVLDLADLILVMTVSPGFGGQEFIPAMLPKIRTIHGELERRNLSALVEVDGGIDDETAPLVTAAGARVLVAGTSIYRDPRGIQQAVHTLQLSAESGLQAAGSERLG